MGQIITLENIISIIEIKSSPDMKIYPVHSNHVKKIINNNYNPDKIFDNPEYKVDYILNVELIEEEVAKYIEDSYGIILDVV